MARSVHKVEMLVPKNYIFEKVRDSLIGFRDRGLIEISPCLVFESGVSITFTYDTAFITLRRILVDVVNGISASDFKNYVVVVSNVSFSVPENLKDSDKPIKFDTFGASKRCIYDFDVTEMQLG